jgi:hypothetical protein
VVAGSVENGESQGGSCSILLVDDNKINQKVVVLMLSRFGIVPTLADSGPQAVELARQRRFDLVLMDLHMPGMDGIEATRQIRSQLGERSPPVVALTADSTSAGDANAHQRGLAGYLTKPVNSETLRQCINLHTHFKI